MLQLKDQAPVGLKVNVIVLSLDPEAEQAAEAALLRACHVAPVEELAGRTVVRLDNNQLSSLPESFGELTALQTLFLDNNQLSSLPESFR